MIRYIKVEKRKYKVLVINEITKGENLRADLIKNILWKTKKEKKIK